MDKESKIKIILLAFVLFFSGCSMKYESQTEVYLKISPQDEVAKSERALDKVLQVRQIIGSGTKLAYVDANGFYNFYAYHKWEEPLQFQIQKLLAYDLGRFNLF